MPKFKLLLPCLIMLGSILLHAQPDDRLQTISIPYDSQFVSSPTLSAVLVGKGQAEINLFNIIQSRELDFRQLQFNFETFQTDTVPIRTQLSNLDHILQLQIGLSENYRFNAGIDLYYSRTRFDPDPNGSLFRSFAAEGPGTMTFTGFSAIGPRVRWMPFPTLPELTLQSSVVFGLGDEEKQTAFGRQRTQALVQATFYQQFARRYTVFGQVDMSYFFENDDRPVSTLSFPLFAYLAAQWTGFGYSDYPKLFSFLSLSYVRNFDAGDQLDGLSAASYAAQVGLGGSLQLSRPLSILVFLQTPFSSGFPNPGPEIISAEARDWLALTIGVRYFVD